MGHKERSQTIKEIITIMGIPDDPLPQHRLHTSSQEHTVAHIDVGMPHMFQQDGQWGVVEVAQAGEQHKAPQVLLHVL